MTEPVSAIDLEDGRGVARRHEVVAVVALGHRVDVEVVPRSRAVAANARESRRQREHGLWFFCQLSSNFQRQRRSKVAKPTNEPFLGGNKPLGDTVV